MRSKYQTSQFLAFVRSGSPTVHTITWALTFKCLALCFKMAVWWIFTVHSNLNPGTVPYSLFSPSRNWYLPAIRRYLVLTDTDFHLLPFDLLPFHLYPFTFHFTLIFFLFPFFHILPFFFLIPYFDRQLAELKFPLRGMYYLINRSCWSVHSAVMCC